MSMTQRQIRFFRALLAPFPDSSYLTSRSYVYLKARTIKIRLDDIVGPNGWTASYTPVGNGLMCSLKINVPDHTADGWIWCVKTDGGGPEGMGMVDKKTGEFDTNEDNDLKSAFTNAFRRAAADWGFGRELYNEGVARFISDMYPDQPRVTPADDDEREPGCDDEGPRGAEGARANGKTITPYAKYPEMPPTHPDKMPVALIASPAKAVVPTKVAETVPAKAAALPNIKCSEPAKAPAATPAAAPSRQFKQNFRPPTRVGKSCYAWMKSLEQHFGCDWKIIGASDAFCKSKGWPTRTDSLDIEQLAAVTEKIVGWISSWPEYDGEFDEGYTKPEPKMAEAVIFPGMAPANGNGHQKLAPAPTGPAVDLKDLRASIVATAGELILKQTGKQGVNGEIVAMIGDVAAMSKNGAGHMGEVMESLKGCTDRAWMTNIERELQRQLERAATEAPSEDAEEEELDELPF